MPTSTTKRKIPADVMAEFEKNAQIVALFPNAKPPFTPQISKAAEQYIIQKRMMDEALKDQPVLPVSKEARHQLRFKPSKEHKKQAYAQENNGSIFSSAFFHIAP